VGGVKDVYGRDFQGRNFKDWLPKLSHAAATAVELAQLANMSSTLGLDRSFFFCSTLKM